MPQDDAEKIKHCSITLASPPVATHCVNVIILSSVLETVIVAPPLCSVNAPLGISLVFHQWNLDITTRVMTFDMLSSEFLYRFS